MGGDLVHTSLMLWILIIVTLLSMWACYLIARSRSANRQYWVVMGLLFGPIAIPFAFFAKPRKNGAARSGR
jgi:uncharacterized membrane protein